MESVIARQLSDFENGCGARRASIQSPALAAMGVAVAAAQFTAIAPLAFALAPRNAVQLNHISYAVARRASSASFVRHAVAKLDHASVTDPDRWDLQISKQTKANRDLNS
jgi:hypothetical protein